MPAYLKAVNRYSSNYTFCEFGAQSNGVPSPESGSQQQDNEINVSLEAFNASLQVNMLQQDLICLLKYLQTMSIKLPYPINCTKL